MESFFDSHELQVSQSKGRARGCGACKLYKQCKSPRMEPTGKGEKGILIIAESPSYEEDKRNMQLIGDAGQLLRRKLKWQGIDLDNDCRKMNAISCFTEEPTTLQIEYCRARVWREIDEFKPRIIMLLGNSAMQSFLGHRWKKDLGSITKWRGWTIPDREVKAWVVPMFHPSYVLRMDKNPAVERVFELDIQKISKLFDKPFPSQMDGREAQCVEIITDPVQLNEVLYKIYNNVDMVAEDLEATGLKPHREGHQILTYGLAIDVSKAYAFNAPESGTKAHYYFRKIMEATNIHKMAHNAKFEDTWMRIRGSFVPVGWLWDSMLAAHVLDNREGITGLKFQAYVRFGLLDYSSHLDTYMKGDKKDANSFNTLEKAPRKDVLLYNGIDALNAYKLAMLQMGELGYDFRQIR